MDPTLLPPIGQLLLKDWCKVPWLTISYCLPIASAEIEFIRHEMPPKPGIDLFLSLSFSCWCVHYSRNIKKRFRITQNRLKLKSQCWKAEEFSLLSPVFGNVSRDFFDGKSIRLIPLDNRFHDIRSKIVQRKNS